MSNKTTKIEIVTPERTLLKDEISQVTVPTTEGEITILPKHSPLISILKPGMIELRKGKGEIEIMSVSGGFVEVLNNKIVILADTAERADEIDIKRAEEARQKAEQSIKDTRSKDRERYANILSKMEKELARTKSVKRWRNIKR